MILKTYEDVSLELALNSRVSTGGWKGIERAGKLSNQSLTRDKVEFVFWCLQHTPHICKEPIAVECGGKRLDDKTRSLPGKKTMLEPIQYPGIKHPSIRLHWSTEKNLRKVAFSTDTENAYWIERGMGQEMVHIAGAIAQVGVNMIGGMHVDLVPMVPYFTQRSPENYRKGTLPDPIRDGKTSAVECIKTRKNSKTFTEKKVSQAQLGQLLWAGSGCTPHKTVRYHRYGTLSIGGQGKTIPSASATYTTTLYVIEEAGIFNYLNWDEEKEVATHSLGIVRTGNMLKLGEYREGEWRYTGTGEIFQEIQKIVPQIPKAPTYIVIASNGKLGPYLSLMEAGYSALHIVLQAQALYLASNISVISQIQQTKIRGLLGLNDSPLVIIPVGFKKKIKRS
jgi:hypothetical protein